MATFCKYLEQISVKCRPCVENGLGACHIKLGLQEYYPEHFQLYDTIQIIRHDARLTVETDIEVKYKTDYPYGRFAGLGPEFDRELLMKGGKIKEYLEPQLPSGVKLGDLHVHYYPDKFDPNVVALHIHVHKQVEDLDEAKDLVGKLAEAIRPSEIEAAIKSSGGNPMERVPVRLSLQEIDAMIADIEARGGDAEELKKRRAEVKDSKWLARVAGKPLGEEEHIEALRQQSIIEHGKALECVICHKKVDTLVSGTCEDCFRKWALTAKWR